MEAAHNQHDPTRSQQFYCPAVTTNVQCLPGRAVSSHRSGCLHVSTLSESACDVIQNLLLPTLTGLDETSQPSFSNSSLLPSLSS